MIVIRLSFKAAISNKSQKLEKKSVACFWCIFKKLVYFFILAIRKGIPIGCQIFSPVINLDRFLLIAKVILIRLSFKDAISNKSQKLEKKSIVYVFGLFSKNC